MAEKQIPSKQSSPQSLVPPHSRDSEMMVLGCMLTSSHALNIGADGLEDRDFYFQEHRQIFRCLQASFKADRPADIHLIAEELKRQDQLAQVGGLAYLTTLAQYAGTSAHIEQYCALIKNKSLLRQMIEAAKEVEKTALSEPDDVQRALDEAQQGFFKISQTAGSSGMISLRELLSGMKASSKLPYLKELQQRQEEFLVKGPNEAGITGVPSYFSDLDKIIGGLGPSNLVIVAARPAMGKTAFAINIAEHVCFKAGLPVGIFSLEMTAEQLLHRVICSQAEVESEKVRKGSLSGMEFQRIVSAVSSMQHATMIIDDEPGLRITDLRARARRMKESYGVQLLVVDYLQLISSSGYQRMNDNRQSEISEISRMLKNLARELNVPVLCLSQLSRKVEERQGHRPMMSDLRESGCLAGDTLITNATTGEQITMRELAERPIQTPFPVFAVDEQGKVGTHQMVKAFYSGVKQLFELKTRSGRAIKASSNHPFLKLGGWTALEALHPGDEIAIPKDRATQWDKIASITPLGEEPVYDATVEGVHNFLANDIFVHNSIEQDADVVLFLLRREYYDPYDKPGQAEVIVAKNRHGGVGSAFLAFRKELAQFANHAGLVGASTEDPFASLQS